MDIKKIKLLSLFVFLLSSIVLAANPSSGKLSDFTMDFARCLYSLLPPISMLLVIAAAITFAGGQLTSAETRARATSWATAMVVGALFGFVLVAILPPLISSLYSGTALNLDGGCSLF
ncbi:MAG: hypothetical protein NC918_04505 [Candidatus Omnitrophica bacterium]|nr:hypothetical protein [Candidatus Omnitrophota bacterium]